MGAVEERKAAERTGFGVESSGKHEAGLKGLREWQRGSFELEQAEKGIWERGGGTLKS